jgi:hypothetical protein
MQRMLWIAIALVGCDAAEDLDAGPDGGGSAVDAPIGGGPDAPIPPGHRISIAFDYRFDDAGFFTAERRLVLAAAAQHWGELITDDFPAIPVGTDVRTRDPEAPTAAASSFPGDVAIDDLLIFAGCSAIDGPGGTLAVSNHSAAINSVTDASLRELLRTRYEGADFQPWTGWISFDCGEDWFFDPTPSTATDLPGNRPDFLSTANHEVGHVLGFGTAMAYFAHVSNATFTGAHAMAAYGGAVPLIANGTHFASGLSSGGREPLLDPSRPAGVRSTATPLDVAVMADLGYDLR